MTTNPKGTPMTQHDVAERVNRNGSIEASIGDHYGERCNDFDPDCMLCRVWKRWDELLAAEARLALLDDATVVDEAWLRSIGREIKRDTGITYVRVWFDMGHGVELSVDIEPSGLDDIEIYTARNGNFAQFSTIPTRGRLRQLFAGLGLPGGAA